MTPDASRVVHLDAHRQKAIDLLTRHYIREHIELQDFENRLDRLYRAVSAVEVDAVLADLPAVSSSERSAFPHSDDVPRRDRQLLGAVMGGTAHRGSWRPARQINALAAMGSIKLDFREASFAAGVTDLVVIALMGGVEILVPPGLRVQCDGIGVMGAFDGVSHDSPGWHPDQPTLRIRGIAFFGGVEVKQRYPGESAGDAKRRLRRGAKARRLGTREYGERGGPPPQGNDF